MFEEQLTRELLTSGAITSDQLEEAHRYLDNDSKPMPAADLPLMRRVALKAGLAFQILLLRNKLGKI